MDPVSAVLNVPSPRRSVDIGVLVRRTQQLLAAGVPLSLLLDLADASGPRSADRYAVEGGDAGWLRNVG